MAQTDLFSARLARELPVNPAPLQACCVDCEEMVPLASFHKLYYRSGIGACTACINARPYQIKCHGCLTRIPLRSRDFDLMDCPSCKRQIDKDGRSRLTVQPFGVWSHELTALTFGRALELADEIKVEFAMAGRHREQLITAADAVDISQGVKDWDNVASSYIVHSPVPSSSSQYVQINVVSSRWHMNMFRDPVEKHQREAVWTFTLILHADCTKPPMTHYAHTPGYLRVPSNVLSGWWTK